VHPANTKANNRAMILIRAIPFCQVSKQERRREWNAIIGIGGWKYDPRENRESARSRLTRVGASGQGAVSRRFTPAGFSCDKGTFALLAGCDGSGGTGKPAVAYQAVRSNARAAFL
jgi:hypothetical protein